LSLQIDNSLMILRLLSPKIHLYSLGCGTTLIPGCIVAVTLHRSRILSTGGVTQMSTLSIQNWNKRHSRFVECAGDFLSYQGTHSYVAPPRWQNDKEEDPVYEYFGPNEGDDRKRFPLHRGLGERADKVLAAHNELYMIGSRFGL
jgi:hypothetical protein